MYSHYRSGDSRMNTKAGPEGLFGHQKLDNSFFENNPSLKTTTEKRIKVELLKKANRLLHHTDKYEDEKLIVRRGQEFNIVVKCDVPFKEDEKIGLQFTVGTTPTVPTGTQIKVITSKEIDKEDWSTKITKFEDGRKEAHVSVWIPGDAIVGRYTLYVEHHPGTNDQQRYKHDETFCVLFNAWSEEDDVFLKDEEERKEYVLNQTGRIWSSRSKSKPWRFNQLDEKCFEAALFLLEKSYLKTKDHGNVIEVTRALSGIINSFDSEYGVLVGNWSGKYEGGTSPNEWTGSKQILTEYMKTKTAVEFGQSWVFSGLTTTVSRALGIPTRSVTNVDSAHDTDNSLTIDFYFDLKGRRSKKVKSDSVWDFHVWNESWFKRHDLPDGNDGWQVFDSTPQEKSDEVYRCGPAPVSAIKRGDVYMGFDTGFVFSMVNGDKVEWQLDDEGEFKIRKILKDAVGSSVLTKSVGTDNRNSIVKNYKYAAGSDEERAAVRNANRYSGASKKIKKVNNFLDLIRDADAIQFETGNTQKPDGDVEYTLYMNNGTSQKITVEVIFTALVSDCMGGSGSQLADFKEYEVDINPNDKQSSKFVINPESYFDDIPEDSSVAVSIWAYVQGADVTFSRKLLYEVEKEQALSIKMDNLELKVNEPYKVTFSFENPLNIRLTNGRIRLEAPGLGGSKSIYLGRDIKPKETLEVSEMVTPKPRHEGQDIIVATFNSRQLTNVMADCKVLVHPE